MAIYVQVLGAFVWLAVVVLLERARRGDRARLAHLEELVSLQGKSLTGLFVEASRPTQAPVSEEHEQTDPAFRLPSGSEHAKPEPVETDDEPLDSVTDAHWECIGCHQAFSLDESTFHRKCEHCGGNIELVTYPKGFPFRHLPAAGATEAK